MTVVERQGPLPATCGWDVLSDGLRGRIILELRQRCRDDRKGRSWGRELSRLDRHGARSALL